MNRNASRHGGGALTIVDMKCRSVTCGVAVGLLALTCVCGCQTTGSWELEETDPPGVGFPLQRLELDESGRFYATTNAFGERVHTQGAYRWRGNKLLVAGAQGQAQPFTVKRHRDGRIEFVHRVNGERISAFFTPVDPHKREAVDNGQEDATRMTPPEQTDRGAANAGQ